VLIALGEEFKGRKSLLAKMEFLSDSGICKLERFDV
jgi:hypothetical protein